MSDLLDFDPSDFYYIKLAGYDSKFPEDEWGGYSQSFVASDHVYSHQEVVESDHDFWGIVGCKDFDHGDVATLMFDLDIHKAPDDFDADRVSVPNDTLIVESQNGGFHVYFKVHASKGELQESDFQMTEEPGWDIDIRGSSVSMHVVAPDEIPGVNSPYSIVNNSEVATVFDPDDAAQRIQLDDEPLLEFRPDRAVGSGVEIDRDVEPPDEMPACYHRGLQMRAKNPDEHPNTHKVNVLTALCGLAAGYEVDTMVEHFCDGYAPGPNADAESTRYHLNHIADHVDRGEYSPPAISTLQDFGILDDGETCNCDIPYHGGDADDVPAWKYLIAEHSEEYTSASEVPDDALATTDGGVTAEASTSQPTDDAPQPPEPRTKEDRIADDMMANVVVPLDPPDDYEGETIDVKGAAHEAAKILDEEYHWIRPRSDTRGWRTTLYNYVDDEGIYEPHGEAEAERLVEKYCGPVASNQFVNEVVKKIERRNRVRDKRLDEDANKIPVKNGILDLTTGELSEFDPDQYHRTKLDVRWDPDAHTQAIDDFIHDVVEDRDVDKLYRFIAHAIYRGYPDEKAAMLLGEGRNGKSMFLELVQEFLGEFNVSHEPLKSLNENEWAPARLNGKLANIVPDMSDQSPDSMQMFKGLTGRDTVHGEVKFEDPVVFENNATLMFACNEMPVLHDDTRGNWRRWQLINFPYTFDDNDPGAKDSVPKEELREQLFTEEEFAGLLRRCVEEIQRWDSTGQDFFPEADHWETTRSKMRRAAEPIYDFAKVCLRPAEDTYLSKDEVRECYRKYASQQGLSKFSDEEFGKRLLNLTDFNIENHRPRESGGPDRTNAYKGIEFTDRGRAIMNKDTPDDRQQVGLDDATGAPPASTKGDTAEIQRVLEAMERTRGDSNDGVARGQLAQALTTFFDMDIDQANGEIDTAKKQGAIYDKGDGLIPT